jgi:PAS domain S-box-containing protein
MSNSEDDLRNRSNQLDVFFDTTLDLLLILNGEGRVVRFNPAWKLLLGYNANDLDDARFLDFVHPSDTEATWGALARMRAPMAVVDFVNRVRQRTGNYRFLEWRASARGDLVYAAARDITDRHLAEENLRHSEARFRAIFEQAAFGVAEVDLETGQFHLANQRFCEILGFSPEELRVHTFQDIVHPGDLPQCVASLKEFLAGEVTEFKCEKRYIHKDGRVVWVALQAKLLSEIGRPSRHFMMFIQDISERQEADAILLQSLADTREMSQRLNFQATRMPLAYITWNIDFRVTQWNAYAEIIFGWSAAEAIGKHAYELVVPVDMRPTVAQAWQECVGGGDFHHHIINDNCTRDGRRIPAEVKLKG